MMCTYSLYFSIMDIDRTKIYNEHMYGEVALEGGEQPTELCESGQFLCVSYTSGIVKVNLTKIRLSINYTKIWDLSYTCVREMLIQGGIVKMLACSNTDLIVVLLSDNSLQGIPLAYFFAYCDLVWDITTAKMHKLLVDRLDEPLTASTLAVTEDGVCIVYKYIRTIIHSPNKYQRESSPL